MTLERDLLNLAASIDAQRSQLLASERPPGLSGALGVLLGTAFFSLTPSAPHQHDAIAAIARDGFRARRRRRSLMARLSACMAGDEPLEDRLSALRRAIWAEKARIALRELLPVELGGAGIEVTASELSDLAAAACQVALTEAEHTAAARFGPPRRADGQPSTMVAIGMGKLGGRELNAGSDVDLIFFYDTDDGASRVSLHEHFTYVAQRCATTIGTPSADGLIWRVDLRLRPEGSQGPLVNSLAAAERYYETWGRLWERAAFSRARPIAGDLALGGTLEREVITPFVYRSVIEPGIVLALAEFVLRARIELSTAPERDLKLGPGGIREAEFFVQALQLVWGGRTPALRVRGTLPALSRLRAQGLVSDREARDIAASYTFLRRVEHHVQWSSGQQTHLLPSSNDELERLGKGLGFSNGQRLQEELDTVRELVHRTFLGLTGAEPPRARARRLPSDVDGDVVDLGRAAEEQLGGSEIGESITALGRRPDDLFGVRTRERFPELAEQVLAALSDCPDPEQAARYLRSFFARFVDPTVYVQALASDARALRRLVTAFGASAFVADTVVSRPELADIILFGDGAVSDPRAAIAAEIENASQSLTLDAEPDERTQNFVAALRAARSRVVLEVAVADLAESISPRDATRVLSELAEEQVRQAMDFELGDQGGLAVLALGALGGKDLGYGSDLDVIFIFDPDAAPLGAEATPHFIRHAQRVIRLISEPQPAGAGYALDARLRPSGVHGLLVTSLSSFARYHGVQEERERAASPLVLSSGAAWERQSLLRARPIAGDPELLAHAHQIAERAAYEGGEPPALELHRVRTRMERELGREGEGRFDLKHGRGGLCDVEFAVQWLQMRHGADLRIRTPDTSLALELLHTLGYLDHGAFEVFSEGYDFLRRLKQRVHVRTGTSTSTLRASSSDLAPLARRMGFQRNAGNDVRAELLARYTNVVSDIRAEYLRVLGIRE
ncbi:MAG TPA: bifunctional [glutamate--ammonia ligase]-adenylyl-L-tyrosine phosphorylase/[glutamate--ammonia-ligase] adenylyltransferase [Polyangiaceae bacterium]